MTAELKERYAKFQVVYRPAYKKAALYGALAGFIIIGLWAVPEGSQTVSGLFPRPARPQVRRSGWSPAY